MMERGYANEGGADMEQMPQPLEDEEKKPTPCLNLHVDTAHSLMSTWSRDEGVGGGAKPILLGCSFQFPPPPSPHPSLSHHLIPWLI